LVKRQLDATHVQVCVRRNTCKFWRSW